VTALQRLISNAGRSVVVQYWKEHFDLLYYMQRNWPALGPKLVDKLHIYVGDADKGRA
jgi:hypothetical protein